MNNDLKAKVKNLYKESHDVVAKDHVDFSLFMLARMCKLRFELRVTQAVLFGFLFYYLFLR